MCVIKSRPLNIAFNQLMPRPVRDTGIIVTAGAEMNNMADTGFTCLINKDFALFKHGEGVAGHHKNRIHAVQCR